MGRLAFNSQMMLFSQGVALPAGYRSVASIAKLDPVAWFDTEAALDWTKDVSLNVVAKVQGNSALFFGNIGSGGNGDTVNMEWDGSSYHVWIGLNRGDIQLSPNMKYAFGLILSTRNGTMKYWATLNGADAGSVECPLPDGFDGSRGGTLQIYNDYRHLGSFGSFGLYSATIRNGGEPVRNYTPAVRVSDNAVGLYDLCGSTCRLTGTPFYVNANNGPGFAPGT